ncbi:MAG: hypothetical protein V4494_02805 [Chlamydiota bacterium]
MVEIKRNKISLNDYDYKSDIKNRILMAQFTTLDLRFLEEILYSPLKIAISKLSKNLNISEEKLIELAHKFSLGGFLKIQGNEIIVDKEMRKYYESQILKFDEEFTPGMEFLQGVLKKVPIQVLPNWYSISRASNNIFESLVEKYLLTPQIFQRYFQDIHLGDPVLSAMVKTVYDAPDFKMFGSDLIDKHGLSREQFEENMLYLEFNLLCCLSYEKVDDEWKEIVTPFQEWREYLRFVKNTETVPLEKDAKIARCYPSDFSFVETLSSELSLMSNGLPSSNKDSADLIDKLRLLKFVDMADGKFCVLEAGLDWLKMTLENQALFIYRQPLNCLCIEHLPSHLCIERIIREAERSIARVLHKGWVYFDDFIKGVIVPLSEQTTVMLKKVGKTWKYTLPEYSEEEKKLIKATIFDWLPKVGIVATGSHAGKDCFYVTPFGASIFGAR